MDDLDDYWLQQRRAAAEDAQEQMDARADRLAIARVKGMGLRIVKAEEAVLSLVRGRPLAPSAKYVIETENGPSRPLVLIVSEEH